MNIFMPISADPAGTNTASAATPGGGASRQTPLSAGLFGLLLAALAVPSSDGTAETTPDTGEASTSNEQQDSGQPAYSGMNIPLLAAGPTASPIPPATLPVTADAALTAASSAASAFQIDALAASPTAPATTAVKTPIMTGKQAAGEVMSALFSQITEAMPDAEITVSQGENVLDADDIDRLIKKERIISAKADAAVLPDKEAAGPRTPAQDASMRYAPDDRQKTAPAAGTLKHADSAPYSASYRETAETVEAEGSMPTTNNQAMNNAVNAVKADDAPEAGSHQVPPDSATAHQTAAPKTSSGFPVQQNTLRTHELAGMSKAAVAEATSLQSVEPHVTVTASSSSSVEVSLQPPGMGKVDIELRLEAGMVNARMSASDHAGKEMLERNLEGIINTLAGEGISVGGFSVSLRNGREQMQPPADTATKSSEITAVPVVCQAAPASGISIFI